MSSVQPENPNTQNAADGQGSRRIHTNEDWMRRWEEGTSDWVVTCVDPMLLEYDGKIFEGRSQQLRVFVPLCGKTPDMKWFADKGHEVVGVELYAPAIELFFSEQGMKYSSADLPNLDGRLYQSEDGMIRYIVVTCICYQSKQFSDMYLLSKDLLGQFDIIWDSRSLIAINVADLTRYRDLLLSLLKPDGLYLLSTLNYDGSVFIGPPHPFNAEHVQQLYGDLCNVNHLDTTETIEQRQEKYKAKMAELEAARHKRGLPDDAPLEIPSTPIFELVKSDYHLFKDIINCAEENMSEWRNVYHRDDAEHRKQHEAVLSSLEVSDIKEDRAVLLLESMKTERHILHLRNMSYRVHIVKEVLAHFYQQFLMDWPSIEQEISFNFGNLATDKCLLEELDIEGSE